jgi:hypothetical protein
MNRRISNNEPPRIEGGRKPGSGVGSSAFSFPPWPAGLVLALLLFAGCHRAAPARPAEHHTPSHRPADYSAAVAQLGRLHEEIVGGRARPTGELDAFTELGDVVRWLPELAADSDLPEEPWTRVARTSDELLVLVARIQTAPRDQRALSYRREAAQWEQLLEQLTSIAGTAS